MQRQLNCELALVRSFDLDIKHSLTRAVGSSIGNDTGGHFCTAGLVRAVTDTVAKVGVAAEAVGIVALTSKRWSEGEHVVDAGLLV